MIDSQGKENWDWIKFFKGFFDGKNYAKAIVLGFCMIVILIIIISVSSWVRSKIVKPVPTQSVGTNSGTITTNNSDNKKGNTISLINWEWFNWR